MENIVNYQPNNILIGFRLGLGDAVLFTPVLKSLRDKFPMSRISLMMEKFECDMLKGLPFVSDMIPYTRSEFWPTIRKLYRTHYDLALCLDFRYRTGVMAFLAGIPERAGIRAQRGLWLNKAVDRPSDQELRYEPLNYVDVIERSTGIQLEGDFTHLYLPDLDDFDQEKARAAINGLGDYVVIAPFSAGRFKNWPLPYYQQLIDRFNQEGLQVVVIGAKWDSGERLHGVVDLMGRTSVKESAYILQQAKLLVCGCCAPIHLGAAVGTPIVGIYGPSSPIRWAPKHSATIITDNPACGNCLVQKGCANPTCIQNISVERVWAAVRENLNLFDYRTGLRRAANTGFGTMSSRTVILPPTVPHHPQAFVPGG